MRTRSYSGKEKEAAIRARYREKERRKYARDEADGVGRSSEDIWKSRDRKVEWGQAFTSLFPKFEGTDEEWNQMERLNRRLAAAEAARRDQS